MVMKSKIYAEVTSDEVNIFTRGEKTASFVLPLDESVKRIKAAALIANVKQTGVRVVDIPSCEKPKNAKEWIINKFKSKTPNQWDMVKSTFPIGVKMNEQTHIFDGSMFTNRDEWASSSRSEQPAPADIQRFFIAALPVGISDEIAKIGMALTENIHKIKHLETVEHLLFRHYALHCMEPFWVVFPQSDGFRILFLNEGLPCMAWHMSNHPEYREDEIFRFLQGSMYEKLRKPTPPAKGVELRELSQISKYYEDLEQQQEISVPAEEIKIALKKAIVLNNGLNLEWMYKFFATHDIDVEKGEYCLGNFLP